MNKFWMAVAASSLILSNSNSFAGDACDGVFLSKEIQIIPLDGSPDIYGSLGKKFEQQYGINTNAITVEPSLDGAMSLVVYETVIPTRFGTIVGDFGKIKFAPEDSVCILVWERNGKTRNLELIAMSPNGDLILSDSEQESEQFPGKMPTLIIKKINAPKS